MRIDSTHARLPQDRPLNSRVQTPRTPLFLLIRDGGADVLDSLLQLTLVLCLIGAFLMCGMRWTSVLAVGAASGTVAVKQADSPQARNTDNGLAECSPAPAPVTKVSVL